MLLLYPGQHAFVFMFVLLIILGVGTFGIVLLSLGIKLRKEKNKSKVLKNSLIVIGIILLSYPLYNIYNYYSYISTEETKLIGRYENAETGYYIEFMKGGEWKSNHESFDCAEVDWELVFTEDMDYIELFCLNQDFCFLQIYSYNSKLIEFNAKQNSGSIGPSLKFEKVN